MALSKLRGIGPATLEKIASIPDYHDLSIDDLAAANSKIQKSIESPDAWMKAESEAGREIETAANQGVKIYCTLNDDYPNLLGQTSDRPFFLFVKGALFSNPENSIAVIGTRQPTEHGRIIGQRLTTFFVELGWSVVSGLAMGLDSVAHVAALDAGGHTVAVLAHGLHTIAPKQNERLAKEILDAGGALITEYGFGVEPFPHQFVKRDRIQAGLAKAVVMVQSDLKGGSLHASRAAIEYGRLLAVPAPTDRDLANNEPKIGANLLLSSGEDRARADLLRCKAADLSRLIVLKTKDDYPLLLDRISDKPLSFGPLSQGTLLA